MQMHLILLVGLAGALGAVARYLLSSVMSGLLGASFPWGIFLVNVLGCLLFGIVVGLVEHFKLISDAVHLTLLTGFMGAFTTFSTFIFDTHLFLGEGKWMLGMLNVAGQIVIGMICLWGGQKFVDVLN